MVKLLFASTFVFIFTLLTASVNAATTQGFTVTSVSLANILHPGDPASKTQWLVTLSLNGGGQSLVGTLDNSTINYQGLTSIYPLQISGSTDPEQAFYIINNANPTPINSFTNSIQKGTISQSCVLLFCVFNYTPAPSCGTKIVEWDMKILSGAFWSQTDVIVGRLCISTQQTGAETSVPPIPNIQFSTHFDLMANSQSEHIDLSQSQQSGTSQDGLVQANWVGSLVTGNAPPDGSQYVAIGNPQGQNWVVKYATDYNNYLSNYNTQLTTFRVDQQYLSNTPPPGCSASPPSQQSVPIMTAYIDNYMSCLQNLAQSQYSVSNQYANNLLSGSVNIGSNTPQLSSYNGQTAFSIPLSTYFVTNPVVVLRFSGSFLGVVIPLGKPKIISATSDTFSSGTNGTIKVMVQNIGTSQGSFYASLANCPGVSTQSSSNYAVQIGQTQEIDVQIYTTGVQQLSQSCTVQVTDYNGGGSDSTLVNIKMLAPNQCTPNSNVVQGNSICSCINVNGVWQTSSQCKICQTSVVSDGKGGWQCASNPNPATTQTCSKGQVFSKDTSQCVDPSQLVGYPSDTICQSGWPSHQGLTVTINEQNNACDLFEVKNSQLLSIAQEAATCFSTHCQDNSCHTFCNAAYDQSGANYLQNSDTFKKFAGLYITYGLGPAAKYMQNYFDAEIKCGSGSGTCSPTNGYNNFVKQLQCKGPVGHPNGWASDTDMSQNSCLFSDLPAHADLTILHTGTCVDYSVSLTTLLRYVGFKNNEVFSVTGPGHEFNLVKFPGDAKWHFIDTVGNNPAVYNPNDVPGSWYPYCSYLQNSCSNDAGQVTCPQKSEVIGC